MRAIVWANSFRDTADVLRLTRAEVAWAAVGNSIGAYEGAVRYGAERVQFGTTIDSHQLIQEHYAKIYSYEGTREMNTLIVGGAITGKAAFV